MREKRNLLVLICVIISLLPCNKTYAYEGSRYNKSTSVERDPSSIIKVSTKEYPFVIVVEKSTNRLLLYKVDNDIPLLLKVYDSATGEGGGDKQKSGDKRTPEGIYFTTGVMGRSELDKQYGIMALPLNYPNPVDRLEGKSGNGIWIHATFKPSVSDYGYSKGCVVLSNADIINIGQYVRIEETPVIIFDRISHISTNKKKRMADILTNIIMDWKRTWENKELDRYMAYYSMVFRSDGKDWNAWREHKRRLNEQYRKISVSIDALNIFTYNGIAVVSFKQIYNSDKFSSDGFKRLYLRKEKDDWKIISEEFREPDISQNIKLVSLIEEERQKKETKKLVATPERSHKPKALKSESQDIAIEQFKAERSGDRLNITFKLTNKTQNGKLLSGRLAIIGKGINAVSYPAMRLRGDEPLNYREAEWYSIRRFKIVKGSLSASGLQTVMVIVYSRNGEILIKREFYAREEKTQG
ncbi:MAG: L,D-transpeptidase family protein [Nitrospirota bacterium]